MGKGKRLLAGSVLLLAASGLIAALWVHSPDTSHPVAWKSTASVSHTTNDLAAVSYPTAIEY